MIKTRLTELLNIEYPVIQGGMVWVTDWKLISAVSNAGGMGVLGMGSMEIDEIRSHIRNIKKNTDKPWAVNFPMTRPNMEAVFEMCLEEGVKIFITSAGNPMKAYPLLKRDDTTLLHVVPSVKGAKKVQDSGYDALVCEGYEAGGHNGFDETTTMALVPQVVDAVDIPVVAAGGIADGRGIAAALALGADGVQMGTRFIATEECPAHINFKNMLVDTGDTATHITGRHLNMLRSLKNKHTLAIAELEKKGATKEEFMELIQSENNRCVVGMVNGDLDEGVLEAGQCAGSVREVVSCAALLKQLKSEYEGAASSLLP
jgi:enoyl-[acyl-carrier protein] reductase II